MLSANSVKKDIFLHNLPVFKVEQFNWPYPLRKKIICETDVIWSRNKSFIYDRKLPNSHLPCKSLQKDIKGRK